MTFNGPFAEDGWILADSPNRVVIKLYRRSLRLIILTMVVLKLCNVIAGRFHRNHLGSRQGSNNTSDGNNRESSLDDSGVVDDHEEGDVTSEDVTNAQPQVSF